MILTSKTKRSKAIRNIRKHCYWHKKFAVRPIVVNKRNNTEVFLSYYGRKCRVDHTHHNDSGFLFRAEDACLKSMLSNKLENDNGILATSDAKHALIRYGISQFDIDHVNSEEYYENADTVKEYFELVLGYEAHVVRMPSSHYVNPSESQQLVEKYKPDGYTLFYTDCNSPFVIQHPEDSCQLEIYFAFKDPEQATMFKLSGAGADET